MTEEQIESVQSSNDVLAAAEQYVKKGEATLIRFSDSSITALCGKRVRTINSSGATPTGGWLAVYQAIEQTPDEYSTCPVLYFDYDFVVLADEMGDEGTESFLQYLESVAAQLRDAAEQKPLVRPEDYDSFGYER